jgi:tetratricopeptide (TPR) repeat protein
VSERLDRRQESGPDGARPLLDARDDPRVRSRATRGHARSRRGAQTARRAFHLCRRTDRSQAEVYAENPLQGLDERRRRDRLADEYDNFRSALAWAIAHQDRELALRLATAATRGQLRSGRTVLEAQRILETALRLEGEGSPATEAKARLRAGQLAANLGDNERSVRLLEESVALYRSAGDLPYVAYGTTDLARAVKAAGNPTRASRLYEESIALCRRISLSSGLRDALHGLGVLERDEGRHERAAELLNESLQRAERADDLRTASLCRHSLADLYLDQGDINRKR